MSPLGMTWSLGYDTMQRNDDESVKNTEEQILPGEFYRKRKLQMEVEEVHSKRKGMRIKRELHKLQRRPVDHLLDPVARSTNLMEEWTEKRCLFYKKLIPIDRLSLKITF